jgi:hypothetical protein
MQGSRRVLAAVVSGVVVFGAGCGGNDLARRGAPKPPPHTNTTAKVPVVSNPHLQAALLRSVARTTAVRTTRTSISVTVTGVGDEALATGAFNIAGTGVVDFANGNADLSLSVPLFDRLGGGGAVEQRVVGGVVYTKLPADVLRVAALPAGVRWLSLDPQQAGTELSALSQAQVDPAGQLAFLGAISADVRRINAGSVRGVRTTRYTATIDLGSTAPHVRRVSAVGEQLASFGSMIGARRLRVDVWIDGSGRARRVVVSVPLAPKSGTRAVAGFGSAAIMRIQTDYYSFGATVRVAAPPGTQVQPYSKLRIVAANG